MKEHFILEIEARNPDWGALRRAAQLTGVSEISPPGDAFGGCFAHSGMHFGTLERSVPEPIRAKGAHECKFRAGYSVYFSLVEGRLDECFEDIRGFVERAASISPVQFVLSLGYGRVVAAQDSHSGFRLSSLSPL